MAKNHTTYILGLAATLLDAYRGTWGDRVIGVETDQPAPQFFSFNKKVK